MEHITWTALNAADARPAPQEQGVTAKAESPALTPEGTNTVDNDSTPLAQRGQLTHNHDVELEALLHGFPPQLLQDGVDAHVAKIRGLVRPRRRRLLGAGIPRSVRHAGSVAGHGLCTCRDRHSLLRVLLLQPQHVHRLREPAGWEGGGVWDLPPQ